MLTLSYGYFKPETPDKGPVVFPALEANWERVNDHDHDGLNSKKLTGSSIESVLVSAPSASWTALGSGYYKQTVNMPAGTDYDKATIQIRLSNGDIVHPTIKRLSTAQFEIYFVDNSETLSVLIN